MTTPVFRYVAVRVPFATVSKQFWGATVEDVTRQINAWLAGLPGEFGSPIQVVFAS